jgi:two-component system KDP operon response regulator KdpE
VIARSGGRVITHQHLFERVWGATAAESPGSFRVHIAWLRNKIEADPTKPGYIRTETRIGYRFGAA